MSTGYLWDPAYLGHETSRIHPERPERVAALDTRRLRLEVPGIRMVKNDQALGGPWVKRVHAPEYVARVVGAHAAGRRAFDGGDTVVRKDSYEVALSAVSGVLSMTRKVADRSLTNGFVACRPPGHHASRIAARGFCIFNNVAIATRFAQETLGLQRVLIVDWDVHPADGTSSFFWDDGDVHVMSVHQHGIFTDTVGTSDQIGCDAGEGSINNVPLAKGTGIDDYLRAFEPALHVAAEKARPDIIFISCGFDAHRGDPIGGFKLEEDTYRRLTAMVMEVADHYAEGRLVSVLEGGYSPPVMRRCVRTHLEALMA